MNLDLSLLVMTFNKTKTLTSSYQDSYHYQPGVKEYQSNYYHPRLSHIVIMIGRAIIAALLSFGLYQLPIPTLTGLLALTLAYLCYVYWVFKRWNQEFAGYRTHRGHKHSPSNRTLPPIKTLDEAKELILNNSKLHEQQFDTCELLNDVQDMEVTRKENQIIRERARRTSKLLSEKSIRDMNGAFKNKSLNMVEEAEELDMDHM